MRRVRASGKRYESPVYTGQDAVSLARVPEPGIVRRETPVREPSIQGAVTVPLLQALVSGVLSAIGALGLWLAFGWSRPLAVALAVGIGVTAWVWLGGLGLSRRLLWLVEEFVDLDLDRDDETVRPEPREVERPYPVFAGGKTREPVSMMSPLADREALIEIRAADARRKARVWKKGRLWDFVLVAYELDDWTRDGWQSRGVGQKEWADVREFLRRFGVWEVQDRPTLDRWLVATGHQ